MRRRKKSAAEQPRLIQRVVAADCQRVAVVGLHPGAGTRTVVQSLVADLHRQDLRAGVTRAPRVTLDDEEAAADATRRLVLPAGTVVATASSLANGEPALEPIETLDLDGGSMGIFRVSEDGPVPVQGPDDPGAMVEVVERLAAQAAGRVLVGGAWERQAFAAPGTTDGLILAVGSGYARSPEHSAAAIRYMIDTLAVSACDGRSQGAWHEAANSGRIVAMDDKGRPLGSIPPDPEDPVAALEELPGGPVATAALPDGLYDRFLAPLVRSTLRFSVVVRDPTRIQVSPVYLKAWLKGRGRVEVVRPARLLAVATNPSNPVGPDAEARSFRELVSEAAADLPVHDVRLESNGSRRNRWKLWSTSREKP